MKETNIAPVNNRAPALKDRVRITAFVNEELAKKFTELTSQIGVSGTAILSRTLPNELNYLAGIPGNSERAGTTLRLLERLAADTRPKMRLNVTLGRHDAERMSQICREKRVPRDSFIGGYIAFLVNGDNGICEAPLKKISEILANPRHEYEEKRRNSPKEDETLLDGNGNFIFNEAVSQENPYRYLHSDEEQLKLLDRLLRNRMGEEQ
jgi:hypothetical protein